MRLVLAVALITLSFAGCAQPTEPITQRDPPPFGTGSAVLPDLSFYGVDDDPVLGDLDAAVQVIAYEAPGCSSCRHYHQNNYPAVKADFIDTGKIAYHFLQWTVGYPYDLQAGIGLECLHREIGSEAYEDGMHRAFGNQTYGRWTEAQADSIRDWLADAAGQDAQSVIGCYDGQETQDEVEEDLQAGADSRAGSNPGFVIIHDGQVTTVKGSRGPYEAIQAVFS